VNAALIGILILATIALVADGMIKVRAHNRSLQRPISPQRMARLSVVRDPLLEIDQQPTVVVLLDADQLFRRQP